MSKIIYDVIQRFEVENGVPRLVSTNIQVIEGGEDLLSLAISMLAKLGFYEKFEEKRTSQYIGYRLKNPGKGAKRYQLVLSQRKDGLYVSLPRDVWEPFLLYLNITYYACRYPFLDKYWVLPSNSELFLEEIVDEGFWTNEQVVGCFETIVDYEPPSGFEERGIWLHLEDDQLFPYTWQAKIKLGEILEEFITHFAKILMEKN
ncbi:hypothetical protein [Trichormus sp. NMC-1]|uniref:hypothetical protein n=1 Tax=Trichormus sp. NMC-1 TaxID=1853259 RepID=UPI001F22AFA0|nr:hypothetical protein [Trichormus sp. NMC-1]